MEPFNPQPILDRLKDFQRRTVDYVFRRLYLDDPPARRFLVADEVGLGKTLIARGVLARTLHHLQRQGRQVNIVYVCSNQAIASQNVRKLNVLSRQGTSFARATRLTLLPLETGNLARQPVNLISLTPGTSLSLLSQTGTRQERAVIYWLLQGEDWLRPKGLSHLLQCQVGEERWQSYIHGQEHSLDPSIRQAFLADLRQDGPLRQQLSDLTRRLGPVRSQSGADAAACYDLTAQLRQRLSHHALQALKPSLIILDEFQRFKDLLDGQDETAELAQALFNVPEVRIMLLSATPYRMLTLNHEQDEDHHQDFLRTLAFLFDEPGAVEAIRDDLRAFRQALYRLGQDDGADGMPCSSRDRLQARLKQVMCRTERINMTRRRDAMLQPVSCPVDLAVEDLRQARLADAVAQVVEAPDTLELWKSSPYLLNFARGYQLNDRLERHLADPPASLTQALTTDRAGLLASRSLEDYQPVVPANGRLRALYRDTLDRGLWRVLWLPPSLPYWQLGKAFAQMGEITKTLIFSSWNVVPDTIASLTSLEVERRLLDNSRRQIPRSQLHVQVKGLLRLSRSGDRLNGMPALALLLPAPTLAEIVDPLALAVEAGEVLDLPRMLTLAKAAIQQRLAPLQAGRDQEGAEDERWYWAAPGLLEGGNHRPLLANWCEDGWHRARSGDDEADESSAFQAHARHLVDTLRLDQGASLGRPPYDLAEVLARLALAGPGVCALRALGRIAPEWSLHHPLLLSAAARVAEGLRTLFNRPESVLLLKGDGEGTYWRRVLQHGLEGNLQAVLDEQVHVLQEALGLLDESPEMRIDKTAEALVRALTLRPVDSTLNLLEPDSQTGRIASQPYRLRQHFALRFGGRDNQQSQEQKDTTRIEGVREAFNSPFWPFVLASTSVGQEGLDFHTWCHGVMHWNLPGNPVDLEQREGRVHRYKGHAVRKNLARHYGLGALRGHWTGQGDPWQVLFDLAVRDRPAGSSDLVPYWIFETDGGARVERRVPLPPMSRDSHRFEKLMQELTLYRLAFGQPRQEDLMAFLSRQGEQAAQLLADWCIRLAPDEEP